MIVTISANVKHWHEAKNDSWFSHIAIEVSGGNTATECYDAVIDEKYDNL